MARMPKLDFCGHYVYLNGQRISFAGRDYLGPIYNSAAQRLVVRASRQVEKSTFLVNTILYEAVANPGLQILFVCPRLEQARFFSNARLLPTLQGSPVIRRILLGRQPRIQVLNMRFANDAQLYVRAAYHSADATRGISADLLLVDEFQDMAAGDLPVVEETLSHSRRGQMILTGTPKSVDNHLETMFRQSTACEWTTCCPNCKQGVIPDDRCLGPLALQCPGCGTGIDARQGVWVRRNPGAAWGDGFWINHLMVPWLNYDAILNRQRVYDPARFKNECLGLPTELGDHIVTRAQLEACCRQCPMAQSLGDVPPEGWQRLVAGVDWGGGGTSRTVLVIGFMRDDFHFVVCRFERFAAAEDPEQILTAVAQRCGQFQVKAVAADGGGNGHVYNRLLSSKLAFGIPVYAILYSTTDHPPQQDGVLWKWTVNRSATIGTLFSRVKKQMILFPRSVDCGSYLDEIGCEVADYDDYHRTVKYTHPETQPDDALHAANYALLGATRGYSSGASCIDNWS
jgi:Phage terminase large subunit (GpA)